MRFLADENFRHDVIKFLISQGHDVKRLPKRTSDEIVAQSAHLEKRILLTNDSDFLATLKFPPHKFSGILVFRILPPSFERFKTAIDHFLANKPQEAIAGKTFQVEEDDDFLEIE